MHYFLLAINFLFYCQNITSRYFEGFVQQHMAGEKTAAVDIMVVYLSRGDSV